MKLKTKKMLAITMITLSIVAILGSISYAYFTAMGETKPQDASLTTGAMSLRFADNDAGINATLDFDESVTKKFTIENTGTVDAIARINWVDLVNTYTLGSLTYTLSQSETVDGTYTEVISKTNVPKTIVPAKKTLIDSLVIPTGKTYYYNLEITFNYLDDINQNDDISANLNTRFELVDLNSSTDIVITFDAQEGETTEDSKVVSYNANNYGTLPTPTRNGYAFLGWFTEQEEGILVDSTTELQKYSNHTLYARWRKQTVVELIIASSKGTVNDFDTPVTTAVASGVYQMADDYGTSYYYRGVVTNNYVKFANFYWRIIRINGDGSLRIMYDGTKAHATGESSIDRYTHINQKWNINHDDNKYAGWMYGPAGTTASTSKAQAQTNTESSEIKKVVDSWYKTSIVDKGFSDGVSDILFCNDRSTPGSGSTGWSGDTRLGYGKNDTAFGATARTGVWNYKTKKSAPIFKCPQKNDAFTVSDISKGNGALTYPVGLITADEVVAAGSGKFNTTNSHYYLYRGSYYWLFSPYSFMSGACVFHMHGNGVLDYGRVYDAEKVAPVINLSAEYAKDMIGTGIATDPYRATDVTP